MFYGQSNIPKPIVAYKMLARKNSKFEYEGRAYHKNLETINSLTDPTWEVFDIINHSQFSKNTGISEGMKGLWIENDYDEFDTENALDTLLGDINANRMKNITKDMDNRELKAETIIFNTDKSDALKGILEETSVSNIFFSPENVKAIQNSIRYYIYKLSGLAISNQSHDQLHILMRSILLQFGNLVTPQPVVEVKRLNQKVVDKCTQNILTEIKQYTGYLEDLQSLPIPLDNPHYANKTNFTYDSANLPE